MLSTKQLVDFQTLGYAVFPELFSRIQMDKLKQAANKIVDDFDPESTRAVFSTKDHDKTRNDYFLSSGDKVRCFFEEGAFDENGHLAQEKSLSINKVGHALHQFSAEFKTFSHEPIIKQLALELGLVKPQIRQSMYIFKQPKIGGEIRWHQDATYFYTQPSSVITFWFAVEDANIQNGCLQVQGRGDPFQLKEQFVRFPDNTTELKTLDDRPWPAAEDAIPLEVKKGSVVVFSGNLPHFSAPNVSDKSRHAYTLHITCGTAEYAKENWLQSTPSDL